MIMEDLLCWIIDLNIEMLLGNLEIYIYLNDSSWGNNIISAKWYFSVSVCVNNCKDMANSFES